MLVGLQRMRRGSAVFLALVLFAAVLSPAQVAAQSQNEVLINVLYDGTSFDTDPLDDGSGNGVHTPGLDGGENNKETSTQPVLKLSTTSLPASNSTTATGLHKVATLQRRRFQV